MRTPGPLPGNRPGIRPGQPAADPGLDRGDDASGMAREWQAAIVWTGRLAVVKRPGRVAVRSCVAAGGNNAFRSSRARGMADHRGYCRRAARLLQLIARQLREGG